MYNLPTEPQQHHRLPYRGGPDQVSVLIVQREDDRRPGRLDHYANPLLAILANVKSGFDFINDFNSQLMAKTDLPAAVLEELRTELLVNFSKYVPADKVTQEL